MQFEIRKCVCVSERERSIWHVYWTGQKVNLGFSFSANPIHTGYMENGGFIQDLDSVKDDKQSKSQIRVINIIHYILLIPQFLMEQKKQQEAIRMRQIPFLAYTRFHFHFQELQRSYLKTSIRNQKHKLHGQICSKQYTEKQTDIGRGKQPPRSWLQLPRLLG